MRLILACLLLTACGKSGGVEQAGGVSSHDTEPLPAVRPGVVGTLPTDAGVAVDAASLAVASDAVPKPAPPRGSISIGNKQTFDESSLTPDVVLAKIMAAYMAGPKRCYKTYLDKDPTARGKLTLSFTVSSAGRVLNPQATGFAAELDSCVMGMMNDWRFPIPKDKDGDATDASFSITLNLVPS